jgi:hypothetical protein
MTQARHPLHDRAPRGPAALRRSAPASLLVVLVALLTAGLLPAASADAAGYTVWSCRGPQGEPLPAVAWAAGGDGEQADACATGGGLRETLGASDTAGGTVGGFRFVLPPGAAIGGWRVWMSASVSATTDGSSYAAGISEADGLRVGGFTAGCTVAATDCPWGNPADPVGPTNLVEGTGPAPGLAVAARCETASGCAPAGDPAAVVELHRSAVDIVDDAAPSVGALAGGLLAGAPVDRPQAVVVPVADVGGGVARVELLVDGALAQDAPSGGACVAPYAIVGPCPSATDRVFTVDPAGLAAGSHSVAARVTDAAGNVTQGDTASFVVGERPAPAGPQPPASPPAGGSSPVADRPLVLSVPGRVNLPERRRTSGRARWAGGGPAAGVRLDVLAGGIGRPVSTMHRIGRVTTRADGTFVLPRTSVSRTLRVVPTSDDLVAPPVEVDLVAPLHVSLRAPSGVVRNGRTTTLRGTVTGAGDAATDLQVLVQTIVRGRWTTVDAVEPGRTGNVVWRYRFQRTVHRAAYRFRFVVPPTKGRPWARATSPRRIVRVDP